MMLDAMYQTAAMDADEGVESYSMLVNVVDFLVGMVGSDKEGIPELIEKCKEKRKKGEYAVTVPIGIALWLLKKFFDLYEEMLDAGMSIYDVIEGNRHSPSAQLH